MKCFFLLLFVLSSCAIPRPEGTTEAEVMYKEAQEFVEDGHYIAATEKLNAIKSQFPYSYYATHAELLLADILFEQESFAESAAAYILFKDFHPKHAKLSYVIWKIAESYYYQLPPTFDRDLSSGIEAMKYYRELISLFPKAPEVADAQKRIKECQEMIEQKEKYIADFYYKTKDYEAARFRYLSIIKNFDSKDLQNYARIRVVESSIMMKNFKDCVRYSQEYLSLVADDNRQDLNQLYNQCKDQE